MFSKHFQTIKFGLGAIALAAGSLAQADTGTLTINVAGILSDGEYQDPGNTTFSFNLGAGTHVTGVAYDVSITAFDPSWLSEMGVAFYDSDDTSHVAAVSPGYLTDDSGSAQVSGSYQLANYGLDFTLGGSGILRVEFYESLHDDISPNGIWNSGTITFTYETITAVPEPASYGLMALGLAALGTVARRRRAQ